MHSLGSTLIHLNTSPRLTCTTDTKPKIKPRNDKQGKSFTCGRGKNDGSYSGNQLSDVNNSDQLTGGGGSGAVVAAVVVEIEGVAAAWTWPDKVTTPLAASQQLVSESPSDIQYTRASAHAHSAMEECIVMLSTYCLVVGYLAPRLLSIPMNTSGRAPRRKQGGEALPGTWICGTKLTHFPSITNGCCCLACISYFAKLFTCKVSFTIGHTRNALVTHVLRPFRRRSHALWVETKRFGTGRRGGGDGGGARERRAKEDTYLLPGV
ncbi:hypothetical protein E2C01_085760 [Portunus trituberculatus]|uniref:Uncharacterized protein n=1 Tax=Portunus trituberculatus TaxID=210409 RepID=A0A5B7J3L4_PORTR|nr:hypothetical protein [Portunus trituberculatus]